MHCNTSQLQSIQCTNFAAPQVRSKLGERVFIYRSQEHCTLEMCDRSADSKTTVQPLVMTAHSNRQAIIVCSCGYFLLLFSPRLISAVADWMSTILLHKVWPFRMQVWNVLHAARALEMQDAKNRQRIAIWAPSHNFVGLCLRNWAMYRQW